MSNYTLSQQNTFAGSSGKSSRCVGYWVENNTTATTFSNIKTDPMHTASLYKDSDN